MDLAQAAPCHIIISDEGCGFVVLWFCIQRLAGHLLVSVALRLGWYLQHGRAFNL